VADQVPLPPPPATIVNVPLIEVRSAFTVPLHWAVTLPPPAGTVVVKETLFPLMLPVNVPGEPPDEVYPPVIASPL